MERKYKPKEKRNLPEKKKVRLIQTPETYLLEARKRLDPVTGYGTVWDITTGTNLTLNADTSSITLSGAKIK